ncbi:MAG: methylmalonyl-CoA mutase cobalamin-binding subunit [Psychromonas sp.]|jgi:methylmalonyl-CoA mutase cobalamin-binding subunit
MIKTIYFGAHNIGSGVIGKLLSDAGIAVPFMHYSG